MWHFTKRPIHILLALLDENKKIINKIQNTNRNAVFVANEFKCLFCL